MRLDCRDTEPAQCLDHPFFKDKASIITKQCYAQGEELELEQVGAEQVTHTSHTLLIQHLTIALSHQNTLAQGEESELEQVEAELKGSGKEGEKRKQSDPMSSLLNMLFSQIFIKAFALTFVAEWGDRSQIATIG